MQAPTRSSARQFDETSVHDEARRTPSEALRVADTVALIPAGTRSLLDVGCGRGELLARAGVPFSVGVDMASRGIRHLPGPKAVAAIQALPFADASFDVVLCAETLEHLDPAILGDAAAELARVARRHVVVTTPWKEDLLEWSHRCPRCGDVFHLHGHRSSLGPDDLPGLFPGARHVEVQGCWPIRPFSARLLAFRTRRLGLWKYSPHALCPGCGNREFANHERRRAFRLVAVVSTLLHPRRTAHRWLLARVDL
jgi:SAM-dependent methyltransferase